MRTDRQTLILRGALSPEDSILAIVGSTLRLAKRLPMPQLINVRYTSVKPWHGRLPRLNEG